MTALWRRHAWLNRLQTLLLIAALAGIVAAAAALVFGREGMWVALAASAAMLVFAPIGSEWLTLRLYRARPLGYDEVPALWQALAELATRAELPAVPRLYYVPSAAVNAFAVGSRRRAAIAVSAGLLRTLSLRELIAVLAHEVAHIAHGDLRVMGLADYVSRLTHALSLTGQLLLIASLPGLLTGALLVDWRALLLLLGAPQLALLAQLGLSRVREYDADLKAAALTGDPEGLASALARIEQVTRSWLAVLLPGWGNPEPSWLRTHPPTEERIRRLLALAPVRRPALAGLAAGRPALPGGAAVTAARPRWHLGGVWR